MQPIQVLFDRADRRFRYGDEITGKVVVEALHDFTYPDVQISYCWRTHGRGDRDSGGERTLVLSQEFSLRNGERREFPFRFTAPVGPVTYHGHYLNVDWYLAATATHGLQCEEDFVLLGKEPGLEDEHANPSELLVAPAGKTLKGSGPHEIGSVLPGEMRGLTAWWFVAAIAVFVLGLLSYQNGSVWGYIAAGLIMTIMIVVTVTTQHSYKIKLDVSEPILKPDMLYPGGQLYCRWDLRIKQDVYLQNIEASIGAKEVASHAVGVTTVKIEEYALGTQAVVKAYGERLPAGRLVRFECSLPLEKDAPPSFMSAHSRLDWWVDLRVNLGEWQGTARRIPITVLPHGYVFDC